MTIRPNASARRARFLLLSMASLAVLLFGIVAMHAQMAADHAPTDEAPTASVMAPHSGEAAGASAGAAVMDLMQHGMGGMAAMDCLLLGMMCLFGAIALVLLLALAGRLRSLLRRRLAVRAFTAAGQLRPPDPPSLLVLSISRT